MPTKSWKRKPDISCNNSFPMSRTTQHNSSWEWGITVHLECREKYFVLKQEESLLSCKLFTVEKWVGHLKIKCFNSNTKRNILKSKSLYNPFLLFLFLSLKALIATNSWMSCYNQSMHILKQVCVCGGVCVCVCVCVWLLFLLSFYALVICKSSPQSAILTLQYNFDIWLWLTVLHIKLVYFSIALKCSIHWVCHNVLPNSLFTIFCYYKQCCNE